MFVDPDGIVHFDKEVVTDGDVMPRLLAIHKANPNVKLFISGDREALHGDVMKLLDRVRSAGIEKVAYEIKIKARSRNVGSAGRRCADACTRRHHRPSSFYLKCATETASTRNGRTVTDGVLLRAESSANVSDNSLG